jgi:hypothetical protein
MPTLPLRFPRDVRMTSDCSVEQPKVTSITISRSLKKKSPRWTSPPVVDSLIKTLYTDSRTGGCMLDISNSLPNRIVYRRLIPQTAADDKHIAELAQEYPAEIDESRIATIADARTYRVTASLVHESESNQLHLVCRK